MTSSPTHKNPASGGGAAGASLASATDVPAPHDPVADNPALFRRILAIIGVGFFIQTIATDSGGIPALPLTLFLKDHLHKPEAVVAQFGLLTGIAWYLKPLAGAVADTFTIRGTRYRGYLLLCSALTALMFGLMIVLPKTYAILLGTFIAVNVFLMFISTVLGGFMVAEGRRFQATGRLSSFRNTAMEATALIAGPVSGYLAGISFGWTAGIGVGLLVGLFAFFALALQEPPPEDRDEPQNSLSHLGRKLKNQYSPLLHSRPFWAAAAMIFLYVCMPGFGTPFLYYQTDVLKLSPQFIGNIGVISGAMSIVGGLLYMWLCKHINLRIMLAISIAVSALTSLFYLFYGRGTATIIVIETAAGLLNTLPAIAIFDLAARATPAGGESMAYSVLMAVNNLGAQLGNYSGAKLHDKYHLTIHQLIVLSAASTLVTMLVVPFLPKSLVSTPDGGAVEAAGDVTGEETGDA